MAGNINCFLDYFKTNSWIVDTGASNHMVSSMDLMSSSTALTPSLQNQVHLPNGEVAQITHKGICQLDKDKPLRDVHFIPMFRYNLLFAFKPTKDLFCFLLS